MEYIGDSRIYKSIHRAYSRESVNGQVPPRVVLSSEQEEQYKALIAQNEWTIKAKDEIIDSLKTAVADQSHLIDEMQTDINKLAQEKELAQAAALKGSKLDKTLTLDYIISQIELKRTYENSRQLIDLLKGKLIRLATDEEVAKIEQVEQKMLDASVPKVENHIKDSQVFQAPLHHPTFLMPIGFNEEMLKEAINLYLKTKNNGYTE